MQAADRQEGHSKQTPSEQALIYKRFSDGAERLQFSVELLPTLLHTSLFLFGLGLVYLLFNVNHTVAHVWLTCFIIGFFIYAIVTFMPLICHQSLYYTPLSTPCWFIIEVTSLSWHWLRGVWKKNNPQDLHWADIWKGRDYAHKSKVIKPIKKYDESRAKAEIEVLESLLGSLDEEKEFEDFLDGLPGLFEGSDISYSKTLTVGLQKSVEPVTDKLFAKCTATSLLPEELRSKLLTTCLGAVWCFNKTIDRHFTEIWKQRDKVTNDPWGPLSLETWAEASNWLETRAKASNMTDNDDTSTGNAVRAHCIQALMAVMWKKGWWQCASPKATELLKRQLDVPSLDVEWLTNEDQLQLAVAANLLSKSLPLLDGQGTSADTNLKIKLNEILDSICRKLDVSDVPSELQDRFVDGAEVMKVFNIQDVDASFGRAAFGPCAKIVK